jgi:hypothetical protein
VEFLPSLDSSSRGHTNPSFDIKEDSSSDCNLATVTVQPEQGNIDLVILKSKMHGFITEYAHEFKRMTMEI